MKYFNKFELSVMIGVLATILCCAATPHWTTQWWTSAFAPLCDGIISSGVRDGGAIVLRSRIWELLKLYVF